MLAFSRITISLTKSVAIGGLLALLFTIIKTPDYLHTGIFWLSYKILFAASFYTIIESIMLPRWSGIPMKKKPLLFIKMVVLPFSEIPLFEKFFCSENNIKPSIFERILFSNLDLDLFEDNNKDEDDIGSDEDVWYK